MKDTRKNSVISAQSGFTLIELLIAILISSIIGTAIILMLSASLETWRFGDTQLSIDRTNQEFLERIVEGTFELDGLRDAVEIRKASSTEIIFVPLKKDLLTLDNSLKPGDKIFLKAQFKPGANNPGVEALKPGSEEYTKVNSVFYYGETNDPDNPDDYITIEESLPGYSFLRIIYYPEAENNPGVKMRYLWNPAETKLYHIYSGITYEIPARNPNVEIKRVEFLYFDNTNNLILPSSPGQELSESERKRITAVKIIIESEKAGQKREAASFVSIRNIRNRGADIIISKDSEIILPDSDNIKALYLTNINGAHEDDQIIIEISDNTGKIWKLIVKFGSQIEDPSSTIKIKSYQVEYPAGVIVINKEIYSSLETGVDFLNLGNNFYDYDTDPNVEDKVSYKGGYITLRVLRTDVDGAAIAVQP